MSTIIYDYKRLYDLIYETISDLEYVHNLTIIDVIIKNNFIVLVYKRLVTIPIDIFCRDLQLHISYIDDTIKVVLEEYDDRYQVILQRKW